MPMEKRSGRKIVKEAANGIWDYFSVSRWKLKESGLVEGNWLLEVLRYSWFTSLIPLIPYSHIPRFSVGLGLKSTAANQVFGSGQMSNLRFPGVDCNLIISNECLLIATVFKPWIPEGHSRKNICFLEKTFTKRVTFWPSRDTIVEEKLLAITRGQLRAFIFCLSNRVMLPTCSEIDDQGKVIGYNSRTASGILFFA